MAGLIRTHAAEICNLFIGITSPHCNEWLGCLRSTGPFKDGSWIQKANIFFMKMHSEIAYLMHCHVNYTCISDVLLHTMQHIAYLLQHTPVLSMSSPLAQKVFHLLCTMLFGHLTPPKKKHTMENICALMSGIKTSCVDGYLTFSKKKLKNSLCVMSADYLWKKDALDLQPWHSQAAVDTLLFKELYDLVINKGDKRLALFFLTTLPHAMGAADILTLFPHLSMQLHTFINQIIISIENARTRKCIRMFFAAPGQCTCQTKCSVYGKVENIQLLAVCKTCRSTPVLRPKGQKRCRRTISSTSFLNVCSVDGNTSFLYVPLYRACVDKHDGRFVYEHWAYTMSFKNIFSTSDNPCIYMLCARGRRTCTNVFLTHSLSITTCKACLQDSFVEKTCLTEMVGNKLAKLCDGCLIAACCPLHVKQPSDVRLSILQYLCE